MADSIQGWIYKITNTVNGKVYVGQTVQVVKKRFVRHQVMLRKQNHPNKHLQASWNKYGDSSFTFEVIEKFDSEMNFDLNNLERYWIKHFDSMNPLKGYNKTEGGSNGKPSEETKKKMSLAKKGKISPLKGRVISEEHRLNLSESHKGYTPSDETRRRLSEAAKKQWKRQKSSLETAEV